MENRNFVGYDSTGTKLNDGDLCTFKIDGVEKTGIICYDNASYAYCFDMEDDTFPSVYMHRADYGTIVKVMQIKDTNDYDSIMSSLRVFTGMNIEDGYEYGNSPTNTTYIRGDYTELKSSAQDGICTFADNCANNWCNSLGVQLTKLLASSYNDQVLVNLYLDESTVTVYGIVTYIIYDFDSLESPIYTIHSHILNCSDLVMSLQ